MLFTSAQETWEGVTKFSAGFVREGRFRSGRGGEGSMVEAAGIEPASEKATTSVSTGVAAVLLLGNRPPSGRLSAAQPAFLFASA
ncbi:MAG: hypothetical protein SLRJCFUN_001134 [Candidatus Fervidibacter sp.]